MKFCAVCQDEVIILNRADFMQCDDTALAAFDKTIRRQKLQFLAECSVLLVDAMTGMYFDLVFLDLQIRNVADRDFRQRGTRAADIFLLLFLIELKGFYQSFLAVFSKKSKNAAPQIGMVRWGLGERHDNTPFSCFVLNRYITLTIRRAKYDMILEEISICVVSGTKYDIYMLLIPEMREKGQIKTMKSFCRSTVFGEKESRMFVRKIKSNKGIVEVGKYGIDRIDVQEDGRADCYTAGGNIFTVKVKEILNDDKVVSNSKNHHKNLY